MGDEGDFWRDVRKQRDEARAELAKYIDHNYELQSLLNGLEAELKRLTTLRPASEHDGKTKVMWFDTDDNGGDQWIFINVDSDNFLSCRRWLPLPDVREGEK